MEFLCDFDQMVRNGQSISDMSKIISQMIGSYIKCYDDAWNAKHVENELRRKGKEILRSAYSQIFGAENVASAAERYGRFLGIDKLEAKFDELVDVY